MKTLCNLSVGKTALFAAALLISSLSFSQQSQTPEQRKAARDEKIEQLKIAFITKELDLSTEEAEKFWPVYNDMSDALKEERKKRKRESATLKKNFDALDDAAVKTKTKAILASEIKEAQLKQEYTEKIAEIIGYRKAAKLLSVEQTFKRELLNRLKEQTPGEQVHRGPHSPKGPRNTDHPQSN